MANLEGHIPEHLNEKNFKRMHEEKKKEAKKAKAQPVILNGLVRFATNTLLPLHKVLIFW